MALSETFESALLSGHLSPLRSFLISDRSLCPEIRANTLSVYYRGGRLLMLQEATGTYSATFDMKYAAPAVEQWCQSWASRLKGWPASLNTSDAVCQWLEGVPFAKAVMDRWFANEGGLEREAQQMIVQENNRDGTFARATDFFFCDMECAENQNLVDGKREGLRFDLVGVHWPSRGSARKTMTGWPLVIAEAKYGDGAFQNLVDHYRDLQALVTSPERLTRLKQAMVTSFQQKHRLGFISEQACQNPLQGFSDGPVVWLLILINHDPESQRLHRELDQLAQAISGSNDKLIQVRIATSNFMGYGLWDEAIIDVDDFLRGFGGRICCRGT